MDTNIFQFCEGRLLFRRAKSESPKSESEKEEKGSEKGKGSTEKREEKPGSSERLQQKIGEVTNALASKLPDFIKSAKDVFANGTKKASDAAVATVVRTAEGIFIKTAKDKWQQMTGEKTEKKTISNTDMDELAKKAPQSNKRSPNTSAKQPASVEDRIGKFLEGDQFTKFMAEFSRLLIVFMKVLSGDFNIPKDLLKRENFLGKQAASQKQELKDVQAQQRILGDVSPQQRAQLQQKERQLQQGIKKTDQQLAATKKERRDQLTAFRENRGKSASEMTRTISNKLPPGISIKPKGSSVEFVARGDVIRAARDAAEKAGRKTSGFAMAINMTPRDAVVRDFFPHYYDQAGNPINQTAIAACKTHGIGRIRIPASKPDTIIQFTEDIIHVQTGTFSTAS